MSGEWWGKILKEKKAFNDFHDKNNLLQTSESNLSAGKMVRLFKASSGSFLAALSFKHTSFNPWALPNSSIKLDVVFQWPFKVQHSDSNQYAQFKINSTSLLSQTTHPNGEKGSLISAGTSGHHHNNHGINLSPSPGCLPPFACGLSKSGFRSCFSFWWPSGSKWKVQMLREKKIHDCFLCICCWGFACPLIEMSASCAGVGAIPRVFSLSHSHWLMPQLCLPGSATSPPNLSCRNCSSRALRTELAMPPAGFSLVKVTRW